MKWSERKLESTIRYVKFNVCFCYLLGRVGLSTNCEVGLCSCKQTRLTVLQYHISNEDRTRAERMGLPVVDYDGIAEVWVDSFEDWLEIFKDMESVADIRSKIPLSY